jgi:hypothetical protein
VISPTWSQLKIGPLLRGERDHRWYGHLFRTAETEVAGLERLRLLASTPRVPEHEVDSVRETRVVEVRGFSDYFSQILGFHALILQWLRAIAHPTVLRDHPARRIRAFAIQVRLGDFSKSDPSSARAGGTNVRLPLSWYEGAILRIRRELGACVPAIVFSDGLDDELAPLLRLPETSRYPSRSSLGDLFEMAQCAVLLGSASTFSMWASYLGQQPTLWHPGQFRQPLTTLADQEIEYDSGPLPGSFAEHAHRSLQLSTADA